MGPKFTVFILVLCLYGVTVNRAQIPLNGPLGLRRKYKKSVPTIYSFHLLLNLLQRCSMKITPREAMRVMRSEVILESLGGLLSTQDLSNKSCRGFA